MFLSFNNYIGVYFTPIRVACINLNAKFSITDSGISQWSVQLPLRFLCLHPGNLTLIIIHKLTYYSLTHTKCYQLLPLLAPSGLRCKKRRAPINLTNGSVAIMARGVNRVRQILWFLEGATQIFCPYSFAIMSL